MTCGSNFELLEKTGIFGRIFLLNLNCQKLKNIFLNWQKVQNEHEQPKESLQEFISVLNSLV